VTQSSLLPPASTRAGTYVRQPGGFRAFVPKPLPPPNLDIPRLQALISKAEIAIGRLDGVMEVIPDPNLFLAMYVRREAVLSSQIEGTEASLMDVLEYEAEMARAEARVDIEEILNYVAAMNLGLARLSNLPLSRRLLCEIHGRLMRGVRGGEPARMPGEFRRSQNWIGGASPASARFVPPSHEQLDEIFDAFEVFLHDDSRLAPIVKVGLAHAQFETIHPFLDGNGRIGRLLITLWLVEQEILRKPLLYLAAHFKEQRDEYMNRLQAVRDQGAWEEWLEFFLDGVAHVAAEATTTARRILELREAVRQRAMSDLGRRSLRALQLLDHLFKQPVVTVKLVESIVNISQPSALSLVRDLTEIGILQEITGRQRNRRFSFTDYIAVFPGSNERA
jgi:Fic family protein